MPALDLSRSIQHQLETLYLASPTNATVTTGNATTIDYGSIGAGKVKSADITITGGVVGDSVAMVPPAAITNAGLQVVGAVITAAATVRTYLWNSTNAAVDPATGVFTFTLFDKT
jgi:hypothetical protein